MQRPIEFQKGEFILREFEEADCAYIILQGEVGIYKRGPNDEIVPLGILKAGEYLGELGILSGRHRSAEAIALGVVKVLRLTKEVLDEELQKAPPWVSALLFALAERLAKTDEIMSKLNATDKDLLVRIQPAVEAHRLLSKRPSA